MEPDQAVTVGPKQADILKAIDDGIPHDLALYQEYVSAHPYPARPESARALELPTTTLDEWITATL